ncbi:uncharacterized protein KY384_002287 [Bacidia gigantensis]|uniref:uncharacterized protein n=1 Tax=Bacidia gigantensis TaxID=2732470 RepID=UPI001D046EEF|nr:uncharacterized protein KY384_002287 [Bacidia gigantensis]KAG8533502.1 hypothetical protein KY384_002287 [Bacidia gigantensis]
MPNQDSTSNEAGSASETKSSSTQQDATTSTAIDAKNIKDAKPSEKSEEDVAGAASEDKDSSSQQDAATATPTADGRKDNEKSELSETGEEGEEFSGLGPCDTIMRFEVTCWKAWDEGEGGGGLIKASQRKQL